jgi:hypothetical protein
MRRHPLVAALALVATALLASRVAAAWVPGGTRVSPVPPQYDSYSLTGAVADGAGGVTLTWLHGTYVGQDDPPYISDRIEAQHIDRDGNVLAGWPAGGCVLRQWNPMYGPVFSADLIGVFPDGAGGAHVVTREHALVGDYIDCAQVYHLAYDGTMTTLGGVPFGLLNAWTVAADADGAGGLVFASIARGYALPPEPPPVQPLLVSCFDATGAPLWTAPPIAPAEQVTPADLLDVAGDGAGGAYVSWVDHRDPLDPDLYVQHVLAGGMLDPEWPAGGALATDESTAPMRPWLRAEGTGGVWVTWYESVDVIGSSYRVHATHLLAGGALAPGMPADGRSLGTVTAIGDRLAVRSDGIEGLYVLRAAGGAEGRTVVLHRLASDGQPWPGWPASGLVLDARPADRYYSSGALALDDLLGVFAAYHIPLAYPAREVLVNEIATNGQPMPGWQSSGQVLASSSLAYGYTTATRSDEGAIVAWTDSRHTSPTEGWGSSVYAQRVMPDGPVATTVALVSAEASADGVRVRWSVTLDGASALAVERRTESGDWAVIARPLPDGDGRVEFMDAAVEPGARYAYRLTWSERGTAGASTPVWVSVPVTVTLSLRVGPNPLDRAGEVRFTLPRGGAASVTILDVAGRRVRELARGTFAAGEHVQPWDLRDDAGRAVGAGLYMVRVESDFGALTRKVAVAR